MIHIANSWPVWLYWLLAAGVSGYFNLDEVKNDIFDVGIAGDPVSLHTTEDGSTLIFVSFKLFQLFKILLKVYFRLHKAT